ISSLPSTSHARAPSARSMTRGVPPTAPKARTGELTPPGKSPSARAIRSADRVVLCSITYALHADGPGWAWSSVRTGKQSQDLAERTVDGGDDRRVTDGRAARLGLAQLADEVLEGDQLIGLVGDDELLVVEP